MTEADSPQFDRPAGVAPRSSDKPKFFTPITVSAIILGSLFGCCGATTVAGHLATRTVSPSTLQFGADDPAIREFTERNAEFQAQVFPYAISAGALGMLHSLALLGAGILAYRRRAIGRTLLVAMCVAGIAVELVSSAVGLYVTKHTSANATDMMRATLAAQDSQQPAAEDPEQAAQNREKVASIASKMTTVLGVGFAFVWFLFKTAYYVTCALYMRRREVVQYFGTA